MEHTEQENLEQDLLNNKSKLVSERSVFADAKSFEFMNIVGDYSSLSMLLSKELSIAPSDDSKNVFSTLTRYLIKLKDQNKFLFIFTNLRKLTKNREASGIKVRKELILCQDFIPKLTMRVQS